MSPALNRGLRKAVRTLAQMIASGGLTALINTFVGGLSPVWSLGVASLWMFIVTFMQNLLEASGQLPVFLPSPGLVSSVLTPATNIVADVSPIIAPVAAATVDAVVDSAGEVTGAVTDLAGGVIGAVTGQLTEDDATGHP